MEIDSKHAVRTIRPDKLVQADAHIPHVRRVFQFCSKLDSIIRAALNYPITMNEVLLSCMESNVIALDEVGHLLMINGLFAADNLGEDVTFSTRWNRHIGGNVPSKRDVLFKKVLRGGTQCRI